MIPPASVTVGPSPLKILRQVAIVFVAGTVGFSILVAFLGFLGAPWLLFNAWTIIACTAVLLACYCAIAVLGAVIWGLPRVEIGPDGFVDHGVLGHRSRRWSDIKGSFTVIRVGWPIGVGLRPVVAYRLTDAFKESARIRPVASLAGNDEADMRRVGNRSRGVGRRSQPMEPSPKIAEQLTLKLGKQKSPR
jgi:hypothetical protein